ncbi:MAG: hypothetical protein ABFS41_00180 [Myxococcota bacterium]
MKIALVVRIVVIGLLAYAGLVVAVESTLGFFQPKDGSTFIITTTDEDGVSTDRVLSQNFSGGRLYASANHWPRAWYNEALRNPRVKATVDGVSADYIAVEIDAEEHRRVAAEHGNGIGLKFLFGFAPQRFLRLDPVENL